MQLYQRLSSIGFLKDSYSLKFLFVAFLGIHIPLIALIFFVLFGNPGEEPAVILLFTLVFTLLATFLTLIVLRKLTWPVRLAVQQLEAYRRHGTLPNLPRGFTDEAGMLLSNLQHTIEENHDLGSEKLDLIYLLSHDLRNFASNSEGLAKMILDEKTSEPVRQYASLIIESNQQQFRFLDNFIRLIKDEEKISRSVPHIRSIEVREIVSALKNEMDTELAAKSMALVVENKSATITLPIDIDLLMRVLANLLDNAIKFSQRGSCIRLTFLESASRSVISVKDDGIGFDAAKSDALFKKFTPMARRGTEREPTTGIGLYLCRKIVEKYDGRIVAESKGKDRGATFSVVFETPGF